MTPTPVQIFSRAPVAGRTKTRLIPAIGAEAAARLHRRLTRRTVEVACRAGVGPVSIWTTPSSRHPSFAALEAEFGVALNEQSGDDLGERMHHALACATRDYGQGLVIGSDCPFIEPDDLRIAAARVELGCDAVLGPARDGGYYLLAVRQAAVELFTGIEWGGERVLSTTRARLLELGWVWSELPARADVDLPRDLVGLDERWLE